MPRATRAIAFLLTTCSWATLLVPRVLHAQVRPGFGAVVGINGLGVDLDLMTERVAPFFRAEGVSLGTHRSLTEGLRMRAYGDDVSYFYVGAGIGQLRCLPATISGTGTGCDNEWHGAFTVLDGAELGDKNSPFAVSLDAGPWLGARSDPSLRTWWFAFVFRYRSRS